MRSPRQQRGLAGAAIIIVIILAMVAFILGRGALQKEQGLTQREVTDANLRRIADALVTYVSLNHRLPCPANGSLDVGSADPENTTTTCNQPDGVVPWKTIGLRRDQVLDGWGRKISYRVFSGANGFTDTDSATMTNCNSSLGAPISPNLGAGSTCQPGDLGPPLVPPPNTPGQYLAARGTMLTVSDLGIVRNGNAFALISHGDSGYGAYLADGAAGRTTLPNSTGPEPKAEYKNTQAGGTYWILARSSPDVAAEDAAHFDDVVVYMSATELFDKAKLKERSWSNFPLSATFSRSGVETALGFSLGAAQDTGRTSLSLGGFQVTATSSAGAENIGFREQGGIGGIGVYSGGSDTRGDIDSAFHEKLTFQLGSGSEFGKMDVALNRFQITNTGPPTKKERAEISFWKAGEPLQTTTVDSWDNQNNPTRCLLRLVSGGMFDRMDVASLDQTNGGGNSRFTVAGIMACTDTTTPCATTVSGAVSCPIPPPSAKCDAPSSVGMTTATLLGTVEDNGVAMGSGTGYKVNASSYSVGSNSITLTTGSGTIFAGNCLTIAGDTTNTYIVSSGISAPGTLVLADPGLLRSIASNATPAVTLTNCQTTVSFDYGITCSYGSSAMASPATINAGAGRTSVTAAISGLTCGSTYYYRMNAASPGGTTTGNGTLFTTAACSSAAPDAQTQNPTSIGTTTARLNGIADDKGSLTTVAFDYGLTSCYGLSIAATPGVVSAGTGSTVVTALIGDPLGSPPTTPLTCNTYYHYRVKAVSSRGTSTGSDTVFLTAPCP